MSTLGTVRHRSARRAATVVVVLAALALSACGGSDEVAESASGAAVAASASAFDCADPVREGIAVDPNAVGCADNGFDPAADEFEFANWGDRGAIDATSLVAMFGPESVCAEQSDGSCTLYPGAQAWADQINDALAGGHCEGMAVLSTRIDTGVDEPAALQDGAQEVVDLAIENENVTRSIEYWWATQLVPEVSTPTAQTRELAPSEIVATLVQGLREGKGFTLGMYTEGGGHAVAPFAVSRFDGGYDIAIYDNNYPGEVTHVIVDPVTETWTYDQAAVNPDVAAEPWSGTGPGTMDLTAMAWRAGPFTAPFAESAEADAEGSRTFLVTAPVDPAEASVGATVQVQGTSFDTTAPVGEWPVLPAGMEVTLIRAAGTIVGTQVRVPASVGDVSIAPRIVARDAGARAAARLRMSVDGPGQPRVTVVADVRSDATASPTMDSRGDGHTRVSDAEDATVSVAAGRRSVNVPMPTGGTVDVSGGEDDRADVTIVDDNGEEATYDLDGSEGEVIEVLASFEDGDFIVESVLVEPSSLDAEVVALLGDDPDVGDAAGSADDPSAEETDGQDAGSDAATDTGDSEAGSDTGGSDAGTDAGGSEAGSDTGGSEAGSDTGGSDAGSDTGGSDTGSDTGGSDTGSDTGGSDTGTDSGGSDTGGSEEESG